MATADRHNGSVDGAWAGVTPSMAATPRARPRDATTAAGQPKMLIMDVCGAYMRPLGGWFAISRIVQLMSELDVDEAATRSALLRMRRRGLLEPERRHGVRGLRLSDQALPMLEEADQRIFGRRSPARLSDGWALVSFSVPEHERAKRHVLRSRLEWLGFGNLSNGLWIAPRRMLRELEKRLAELGYQRYVLLFEAHYHGFEELQQLVRRAWDLTELGRLYSEFIRWGERVEARWSGVRHPEGRDAFVDYTFLVYHWRKFPYLDPGLPVELLPDDWAGHRAAQLFLELRTRLEDPALEYVRKVCAAL